MAVFKFSSFWKSVFLIFFFSLLVRLIYFSVPRTYPFEPQPGVLISDASNYDEGALNIIYGKGYQFGGWRAQKPPLYSIFLAGHYALLGRNLILVKLTQALLASLTTIFIFLIGRRLFGDLVGMLAALFHIIYLPYLQYTFVIMTETLLFFLMTTAIYSFLLASDSRKFHYFTISGFAAGLAVLTKSSAIILIGILSLWFFIRFLIEKYYSQKKFFLSTIIFLLSFFLTITPWLVRNWLIFGDTTLSTVGASHFWPATNPKYGSWNPKAQNEMYYRFGQNVNELEWEKAVYKDAFRMIARYPKFYLAGCIKNIQDFWRINPKRIIYLIKTPLSIKFDEIITMWASLGLLLLILQKRLVHCCFFLLIIFVFTFENMTVTTVDRYRWQIDWLLAILASFPIAMLLSSKIAKSIFTLFFQKQ